MGVEMPPPAGTAAPRGARPRADRAAVVEASEDRHQGDDDRTNAGWCSTPAAAAPTSTEPAQHHGSERADATTSRAPTAGSDPVVIRPAAATVAGASTGKPWNGTPSR